MNNPNQTTKKTNQEWIEKLFWIRNKRREQVRLKANPSQQLYLSKRRGKNLILKGRQQGMSKWIDADQLMDCMRYPTNAVVISHEKDATRRLFNAVKFYI